MKVVERAALVEELGIGRVQILGDALALVEDSAPEGDHPPARVLDRQHHPPAEAVVSLALFIGGAHSGAFEHLLAELGERLGQRLTFFGCPAKAEFAADSGRKAAPLKIIARDLAARRCEAFDEEPLRRLGHIDQAGAGFGALGHLRIGCGDVHPGGRGQLLDRVHELQAGVIDHPADRIAMRAAAEAVVELLLVIHIETRGLLVVERAAPLPLAACARQLDRALDKRRQRDPRTQLVLPLRGDGHGGLGAPERGGVQA